MGVYNPKKLMGVTTLDVVRAKTFYAEKAGLDVSKVDVPVIGGHAGITILPLFSRATDFDKANLDDETIKALTTRTQDGGTEVVQAKAGKGSATLSMAYAAAIFGDACMRGMSGESPVECTYIQTDVVPGVDYFSTLVQLGKGGVEKVLGNGELSAYENEGLDTLKAELKSSIEKGVKFVKENQQAAFYARAQSLRHLVSVTHSSWTCLSCVPAPLACSSQLTCGNA
eukprot:TRINITY_DN5596_c1_g1_i1.p1 TRINITY_DN5596_c1_g1~~TRINITY_DN5596_c1_g1_i1.p1  ORF type:complete len:227 (-),score=37.11 TRINITY_DN5596_c1_g1_i1:429-1109(-)